MHTRKGLSTKPKTTFDVRLLKRAFTIKGYIFFFLNFALPLLSKLYQYLVALLSSQVCLVVVGRQNIPPTHTQSLTFDSDMGADFKEMCSHLDCVRCQGLKDNKTKVPTDKT